MEKCSGIDAVHNFWEQVWQSPQNYDTIDDLVVEDFVIISGGRRIEGREAFKKWAEDFSAAIGNFDSCRPHIVRLQGSSPIGCKLVVGRERLVDLARGHQPSIVRSQLERRDAEHSRHRLRSPAQVRNRPSLDRLQY
jgi:hypothetical protein